MGFSFNLKMFQSEINVLEEDLDTKVGVTPLFNTFVFKADVQHKLAHP